MAAAASTSNSRGAICLPVRVPDIIIDRITASGKWSRTARDYSQRAKLRDYGVLIVDEEQGLRAAMTLYTDSV